MAGKTALLFIADENMNQELVTALSRLGIDSVCIRPNSQPPKDSSHLAYDYLFIDEDCRWVTEQAIYANLVKQKNSPWKVTILSSSRPADFSPPPSDAYLDVPVQERLLRAVLSHQQKNKATFKSSEQKYRVLFNSMREGMVLHEIVLNDKGDPVDFRYLDVNPVFERLTGLNEEDLIGQLLSQTPHWYDADWPTDYLKVARTGKPYRVEIYIPELDRHFDIVAFRPQPGQCAAIISDITVRIVHEKEIEGLAKHSSALRSVETPEEITQATLSQINELIKTDRSLLALTHPRTRELVVRGATGQWKNFLYKELSPDDPISRTLLMSGDILYRDDLSEESESILAQSANNKVAFLGVPLIVEGAPIGFLALGKEAPFTTAETYSITAITENTASAVRRSTLHEQTQIYADQMKTVSEIGRTLVEILDLPALYSRLCTAVADLLEGPDLVVLWLWNSQNELAAEFAFDEHQPLIPGIEQKDALPNPPLESLNSIIQDQLPYIILPAANDALQNTEIIIPIYSKGKNLGALTIQRSSSGRFDENDAKLISLIAHMGAIAIENARLLNDLQRSNTELTMAYDTTLEGWSFALDLRDKETECHTKRVTSLTLKLAREMGIREEELVHIRRGALLHDIGKMGIRDNILLKPGPLTLAEREIMNKHPVYAYEMLSRIDFLGPAIEIPYYHHEKWDGTGYPNGLHGDQIPLSARIFAVVDVWDSLISDRPYRKARTKDEVIQYIQEMSGSHFDPAVVKVFMNKRLWAEESTEFSS